MDIRCRCRRFASWEALVGSDVPFCVMQGTVLVEGVGNKLTKLPDAPEMFFAVCKPEFSVSTPELYRKLDETFIEKRRTIRR